MSFIKCPECKDTTFVFTSNYEGTLQCRNCAGILEVKIVDSNVSDVKLKANELLKVTGLPKEIDTIYSETQRALTVKCYTATELLCRKILMYVAAEKGAPEGKNFIYYLDYLEKKGIVAQQMRNWVDLIRQHGNESAHLLVEPDENRAHGTFTFTAELLRVIYEMPFMSEKFTKPKGEK